MRQLSRYALEVKGGNPVPLRSKLDDLAASIRKDLCEVAQGNDESGKLDPAILNLELMLVHKLRATGRVYEVSFGVFSERSNKVRPAFCALYQRAAAAEAPITLTTVPIMVQA